MPWAAEKLPRVVLDGIDRGESRVGRLLMWTIGGFAVIMGGLMFVLPDPGGEALTVAPWMFGSFGAAFAYAWWLSRKRLRVHASSLGRALLATPQDIVAVREEIVRAGTGSVQRIGFAYDGEREFQPRPVPDGNVVGVRMRPRSWFHLKLRGKWLARKLVIPTEDAPQLASWLFAKVAAGNPECRWGQQGPVRNLVGDRAD
jgi:hypothetical protein